MLVICIILNFINILILFVCVHYTLHLISNLSLTADSHHTLIRKHHRFNLLTLGMCQSLQRPILGLQNVKSP